MILSEIPWFSVKKQYFSGNTAFHLKMWFGAEMEQNTYHIPLVLQYFLQGTLGINFSAENHGISYFSWNSYSFRENSSNSLEFSIFAEIAIPAPPLPSGQRDGHSRIWTGPGCVRGESMGRRSRGARRDFFHRFPLFFSHPLSSSVGVPRLLRRLLTPPHSNIYIYIYIYIYEYIQVLVLFGGRRGHGTHF